MTGIKGNFYLYRRIAGANQEFRGAQTEAIGLMVQLSVLPLNSV